MNLKTSRFRLAHKVTAETGEVIGAAMVSDEDNILVIGNKSSICFSAKDIPLLSKQGLGNILLKNNKVISIAKL